MKLKYILFALCLFRAQAIFAQTDSFDVFPEFKGNVNQYLASNIVYPAEAREAGIEGKVVVRFIVNESGNVDSIMVVDRVHPSIDREAARLIAGMRGMWKPGIQNGKPVKVYYTLPITFSLGGPNIDDLFHRGVQKYSEGKIAQAMADFKGVLQKDPNHNDALFNLAVIYIKDKNKPEKACSYLQRIKKNGTQNVDELLEKYCK